MPRCRREPPGKKEIVEVPEEKRMESGILEESQDPWGRQEREGPSGGETGYPEVKEERWREVCCQ